MPALSSRTPAKRDTIHTAAQRLFIEAGFEGASMDAIALEAGVSKQTLYRYYQSKETLFVAVLEQLAFQHFSEGALLAWQDTSIESLEALEHALTVWAQATMKNLMQPTYLGLLRLLIAESPRFPQLSSLFEQAIPQQGGAFLQRLLEQARKHGVPIVDDLELVPRLLAGAVLTYALSDGLLAPDGMPNVPEPKRVAALIRLALTGIIKHS